MFVQIHMLQSMPPGNTNRDDTGQPKMSIFGGVTRGRISSQCLKRNIRLSQEFKDVFGDALADRTLYLPRMVADELRNRPDLGIPDDELEALMDAIAKKFTSDKKDKKKDAEESTDDADQKDSKSKSDSKESDQTGQLVFFQQPFARRIAELAADFRSSNRQAYDKFIGRAKKLSKEEKKKLDAQCEKGFIKPVFKASQTLTVDIGLFGRMTTSDLVAP